MRTPRRSSNIAVAIAAGSLVLAPVVQARAQAAAQNAAAPAEGAATPEAAGQTGDLPSRVGRLAKISGTVSFHTADEDHWDAATLNYPLTSGDAFWTEPDARASLEISASRIDMASTTEFDVDQLDDHSLTATEAQGETFLDLRDLASGETYTVRTPRGVVTMAAAGQYEIAAGDTQSPTTVTVLTGSAQITGDNLSLSVPAGQTATITGSGGTGDAFRGSLGPQQRDTFLASELTEGVPTATDATAQATVSAHAPPPSTGPCDTNTPPAAVQQMPGGQQLSSYGSWQNNSQYGRIWYPRVSQDWVPYRDGHWAWIAPWGWTWIDAAPWGYAPFHYGRWVYAGTQWAWAPTWWGPGFYVPPFYRPVYAPALVGFFGFGVGLAAGLSIGIGFGWGWGHIGWCPLGFGEPFHPFFPFRPGFFSGVNRFVVNNGTININKTVNITKNITINNFANAAHGATVVPTSAMLNSQHISSVAHSLSRSQFSEAHPVSTAPRPTENTAGMTPRTAERLGLPNAAHAGAGHESPGPHVTQAGAHGSVPLRPASGAGAHTAQAAAGAARLGGGEAGRTGRQVPAGAASAEARANQPALHNGATAEARANQAAPHNGTTVEARANQLASHNGLPPLRTAGATPRVATGAPGPAITPRDGQHGPAIPQGEASRAQGRTAFAANEAQHGAPGPAIERHGETAAGVAAHNGLPSLRTPIASTARPETGRGFGGMPGSRAPMPAAGAAQRAIPQARGYQAPHAQAPETPRTAPQTRYQAPRSQAPQSQYRQPESRPPQYQQPQYQQPQYRQPQYQRPQYQQPQYRQQYAAPRYQYQAPRYQAPQRYDMPAQRYAAPRGGAPGGRRPWIP